MDEERNQPAELKPPQPNDAVSEGKVADAGPRSQSRMLSKHL